VASVVESAMRKSISRDMPRFGNGGHNAKRRRLVGDHIRLPIRMIPRWGTTTVEWPQNVASALSARVTRTGPLGVVISTGADGAIEIGLREWAQPVIKGRHRGTRTRFVCPRCEASRDALHWSGNEWGCRGCLDLSYACRHRQRYCPSIARRARLRRKLARLSSRSLSLRDHDGLIERERHPLDVARFRARIDPRPNRPNTSQASIPGLGARSHRGTAGIAIVNSCLD